MQKLAHQFIDLLESQQLLSPEILEELRRQVAESKTKLSPELLAKLLVDNGHLTKFQATKLISEIKAPADEDESSASAGQQSAGVSEDDELGFAPDSAGAGEEHAASANQNSQIDEASVEPVEVVEPIEVVQTVDVVETYDEALPSSTAEALEAAVPTPRAVRPQTPKANPWDSFRILGVGLLLALVLIAGYFLLDWFLRGSAEERLALADGAYEQRSYETATAQYEDFSNDFPTSDKASYARVRAALAKIRKDVESARDPQIGLDTALAVLPGIAQESGLAEQRSDLAGALVSLAESFNDRADTLDQTDERKSLMVQMDRLMELINDPQYVGTTERETQGPTLKRIVENQKRILREIGRDERLATALKSIDEKLTAKDPIGAYAVRSELIDQYPLLETNSDLQDRVLQASKVQQELVKPGSFEPVRSQGPAPTGGQAILLGNRSGSAATDLRGQVVFVNVKGSVFGLEGESGNILWSQYLGQDFTTNPVRIGSSKSADAMLFRPSEGKLWRVQGETGDPKWHLDFGRPIYAPTLEGNDLFVSCADGHVFAIDAESGQTKWSVLLPQPVEVSPGAAFGKPYVYVSGEHSNLYAISRRNGECKEVFYSGHLNGAISVSPALLLGQLFLFENISTSNGRIRILGTSEDGLQIKNAQSPFPVEGNVVVPPVLDGRRIAVQSDLGQITVLDVEPTMETQKVTKLASIPKNLDQPQLAWSVFAKNKLWVADKRFTRFDLQVSLAKLNRTWTENDGDIFTGPPQLFNDTIIHTRQLRGNQGVRVAAINSDDGSSIWENDLGAPISYLGKSEGSLSAVTSSASYFNISNRDTRSQADANPSKGRGATLLVSPVNLGDTTVLVNQSRPNQIGVLADNSFQLLSLNLGNAKPTCDPIAVGDKLGVGLSNGQFVLFDPSNGSQASAPYQPPMKPNKTVNWVRPVYLSNSQTIVLTSNLQKLVRLSAGSSLRSLTSIDLESPLVGKLAVIGNQVVGVSRKGGSVIEAVYFNATSLAETNRVDIEGRLIDGPYATGESIVIQSTNGLYCFDSSGQQLWQVETPRSKLVGAPIADGNALLVATVSGQVWAINAESGEIIGKSNADQAVSTQPVVTPTGLVIGSSNGSVIALQNPSKN